MDTDAIIGITDFGRMVTFIDASYAVHANMRTHTGGAITFGMVIARERTKSNGKYVRWAH